MAQEFDDLERGDGASNLAVDLEKGLQHTIRRSSIDNNSARARHESMATTVTAYSEQTLNEALPTKTGIRLYRFLRWNFFSCYRRLFTICFIANLATLVGLAAFQRLDSSASASAASVNLLLAILMRQEHVVNTLFLVSSSLPTSWPLSIRRWVAKVYSYGGLHSGCGVAAVAWYIAFTGYTTKDLLTTRSLLPVGILAYLLLIVLFLILGFAHPTMRMKMHDHFELTHRFLGWAAVAIYWAQTLVVVFIDQQNLFSDSNYGSLLVRKTGFWCLVIITLCLVYPWLRLRHRRVRIEYLSGHAARLHFDYTRLDYCMGIRLSTNPLFETHAFATLPEPNKANGFSVVVSNAGDWTRDLIRGEDGRNKIWVKGAPTYGVLRIAGMFKRTVIVATGSGIGPCLSLLNGRQGNDCRILWSTPAPLKTYGQNIVDSVLGADPNAEIIDTKVSGRPNMVSLTYKLYQESGAEAVIVISNPKVTRKVVYGMETRGVSAYGPIFDS